MERRIKELEKIYEAKDVGFIYNTLLDIYESRDKALDYTIAYIRERYVVERGMIKDYISVEAMCVKEILGEIS